MHYEAFKDICDRLFAFISFLILFPLLFLIYLSVFIVFGSPVLFRQERPGRFHRPFMLLKFRTMTNARDLNGVFLPDDQRLNSFGRLLRNLSLDELPALVNVLRGDMSLIGPRPLLMQYLTLYTDEQLLRHNVKPGFSGWAQVNGRNALSWEDKFRYDVWYVRNQSFWLDLRIFFLTIVKVFSRDGITSPGQSTTEPFTGTSSN